MSTTAEIIRAARKRLRLSQAALAALVGVSRAAVGQWEDGTTSPTRRHAPAVAKALGLPVGSLDSLHAANVEYVDSASQRRTIPIVEWDRYRSGTITSSRSGGLMVDGDTPADAVALRVLDDSMLPDFQVGDLIVVSHMVKPRAQDVVIAEIADQTMLLRQYMPRGQDRGGAQVFDLLSTAPDWPTITCNTANPGKVLGTVILHQRRLRR